MGIFVLITLLGMADIQKAVHIYYVQLDEFWNKCIPMKTLPQCLP
jgi:hypothetical protein